MRERCTMLSTALVLTLVSLRRLGSYFFGDFINLSNVLDILSKFISKKPFSNRSVLTTNRLLVFFNVRFQCFPAFESTLIRRMT